jgi:hypothetical protein
LETPRHLVLFNRKSLGQAIIDAGFLAPNDRTRPSACAGMFQASFAMEHGYSPYEALATPMTLRLQTMLAAIAERLLPSRREFLTVTATKAAN